MNRFISPLAAAVPGLLGLPAASLFRSGSPSTPGAPTRRRHERAVPGPAALRDVDRADRSGLDLPEMPRKGRVVEADLLTPSV